MLPISLFFFSFIFIFFLFRLGASRSRVKRRENSVIHHRRRGRPRRKSTPRAAARAKMDWLLFSSRRCGIRAVMVFVEPSPTSSVTATNIPVHGPRSDLISILVATADIAPVTFVTILFLFPRSGYELNRNFQMFLRDRRFSIKKI